MSLGKRLVINGSDIDDDLRLSLLKHPYFTTPGAQNNLEIQDHFIGDELNEFDQLVVEFLKRQRLDYGDTVIEYWFQSHETGSVGLRPHCDYNFIYREKMKLEGDNWPHKVDRNLIVSPVTIAVYLEVDNLIGGELGVSFRAWYEDTHPLSHDLLNNINRLYSYELYGPEQGNVLYFKGSEHYHWIEPIQSGTRKSMLINFWPKELLDK